MLCYIDTNKKIMDTNSYYFIDPDLVIMHYDDKYVEDINNYNEYKNNMLQTGIDFFYTNYKNPNEKNRICYYFGICLNKKNNILFYTLIYHRNKCNNVIYRYIICDLYTNFYKFIIKIKFYKQQLQDNFDNHHVNYHQFDDIITLIHCMYD